MIKFFRTIRQNLLKEGKTSRYLKYAIGEIFLVVIGILIALQINNWNENRKLRIQEVKYLKNLQTDLITELKSNDSMIVYRNNKARAAASILTYTPPKTPEQIYKFEKTFELVYFWKTFIPSNNTFKELSSSGNLNTLKNDSLKYYLLELDKMYVEIANYEHHMRREYEQYIYDVAIPKTDILNFFDFEQIPEYGKLKKIDLAKIAPGQVKKMEEEIVWLLNNKTLRNAMRLSVMNNRLLKNKHVDMRKHIERMLELIDQDLGSDKKKP
jgi:hypothetical protein